MTLEPISPAFAIIERERVGKGRRLNRGSRFHENGSQAVRIRIVRAGQLLA
jgi:hypothetical protein